MVFPIFVAIGGLHGEKGREEGESGHIHKPHQSLVQKLPAVQNPSSKDYTLNPIRDPTIIPCMITKGYWKV